MDATQTEPVVPDDLMGEQALVVRIAVGLAILELDGDTIDVAADALPPGAGEGAVVRVRFDGDIVHVLGRDHAAEEGRARAYRDLQRGLRRGFGWPLHGGARTELVAPPD